MWDELMGKTNYNGAYVYLSDGGHFENLGLYELARRRCKVIIVSDASTDPEARFQALGNAIERCRVDLGAEIDLRVMPSQGGDPFKSGISMGRITYADGQVGVLCYIKPILNLTMPLDAHAYAQRDSEFPHHPIREQWFGESQFESYRILGRSIADVLCTEIVAGRTGNLYERCVEVSARYYGGGGRVVA